MNIQLLPLLKNFYPNERTLDGKLVNYADYDFDTLKELDRLRDEIGSRCVLIRGSHGLNKETAVDFCYPDAPYSKVAMAIMRSGFSKGFYQGGSGHLDSRMGANGLARCWIAFHLSQREDLVVRGFWPLYSYTSGNWLYFKWGENESFSLLNYLVDINT